MFKVCKCTLKIFLFELYSAFLWKVTCEIWTFFCRINFCCTEMRIALWESLIYIHIVRVIRSGCTLRAWKGRPWPPCERRFAPRRRYRTARISRGWIGRGADQRPRRIRRAGGGGRGRRISPLDPLDLLIKSRDAIPDARGMIRRLESVLGGTRLHLIQLRAKEERNCPYCVSKRKAVMFLDIRYIWYKWKIYIYI